MTPTPNTPTLRIVPANPEPEYEPTEEEIAAFNAWLERVRLQCLVLGQTPAYCTTPELQRGYLRHVFSLGCDIMEDRQRAAIRDRRASFRVITGTKPTTT